MDGQLIVVEYNDRKNAFEGKRNKHKVVDIESKLDIAPMIEAQLKNLKKGGCVLVKFAGSIYLCEKNNVKPDAPYQKHKITYHPLMSAFTI